ncbi:hypothetical protein BHM03_00057785 [Ensete ventricosum]|nr:hypothetical protein BHM03_00057785 [Ensete ventricosum]
MDDFLIKFFPAVYRRKHETTESNYCKYDNQGLQLFTSSLYLAGLTATFFASYTTRNLGRRLTMLIAGIFFIVGVILTGAAQDLPMLIVGRILLGCGVGFANQVRPSPLLVVDTPNSLIERGRLEEGKAVLKKIRGTENVEPEYNEILEASRISHQVKHPFRNLLQRRNRPQLIIAILLQIFQQFTGINAIMFYAPVLFNTLGFKSSAALYSAVITGAVNVLSTVVSIYSVDKVGRRVLLLEAGVQMFLSQVVIAVVLGVKLSDHSDNLGRGYGIFVVVMVCTFVSSFAWSWGPLGWLIPSETFPLETRSAGQSVTVCVNLLFTFVIAQAFLSMLCHLKYGIFVFFSAWVVVMSVFVLFFLPETKNTFRCSGTKFASHTYATNLLISK